MAMNRRKTHWLFEATAMLLSIAAGLVAGWTAWDHMSQDLLPDLSEQPALVSFYKSPSR